MVPPSVGTGILSCAPINEGRSNVDCGGVVTCGGEEIPAKASTHSQLALEIKGQVSTYPPSPLLLTPSTPHHIQRCPVYQQVRFTYAELLDSATYLNRLFEWNANGVGGFIHKHQLVHKELTLYSCGNTALCNESSMAPKGTAKALSFTRLFIQS